MDLYATHNERRIDTDGSFFVGELAIPFGVLNRIFGKPDTAYDADGKTDAHWSIRFTDGAVCAIYNYKTGRSYLGPSAPATADLTHWSVGAHERATYTRLIRVIEEYQSGAPQMSRHFDSLPSVARIQ